MMFSTIETQPSLSGRQSQQKQQLLLGTSHDLCRGFVRYYMVLEKSITKPGGKFLFQLNVYMSTQRHFLFFFYF